MKVLYLTYDGLADPLGGSQVLPYLIGLSKLGHEISVISFEKADAGQQALNRTKVQCAEHGIDWQPMHYHRRPAILSTIWDVAAMRIAASRLRRRRAFDLAHCRSYVPALVGLVLKRQNGVRFLFDMRGFWPDERVESGRWNLSNPLFRAVYGYFKRMERQFLAEADAIVTLTNAAREEMLDRTDGGRPAVDPQVIPCCTDFTHFLLPTEDQRNAARRDLGLSTDTSVLCYLGSLGGNYLLDEMLGFFAAYREQLPEARFLFITREPAMLIVDRARQVGIGTNELIIRPADRDQVPLLVLAADHGIAFKRASLAEKACSPTKIGEMMALDVPVVVNAGIGDVDRVIADTGAGVVVGGFDHASLKEAVESLIAIGGAAGEIREGARRWFDLENGVAAYDSIYRSLASQ